MRCLVTGAAGFLGSHLLACLLRDGHSVTLLLRPSSSVWRIEPLLPQVKVIRCDLADIRSAEDCLNSARPEVVYHLAWFGGGSGKHKNDLTQIGSNLPPSIELFQMAAAAGARRWVGCGSAAEYGAVNGPVTEEAFPEPHTLYGISKYALCLTTAKMCSLLGLEYLWARPFALYGPQDHAQGLIPFVTRTLLRGERPALTAGGQRWDYLHVEDAAQALADLASAPAAGIFNIASGEAVSLRNLIELIRDLIDPTLPLGFGEIPYPADQMMSLQADTSKLRNLTNWLPRVSLEEGLKRVIKEYRRDEPC